jgi:hypothetical protein
MAKDPTDHRTHERRGWSWFDNVGSSADVSANVDLPDAGRDLRLAYARCFNGPDGEKVLNHLRTLTLDRALGPDASAQMLRHTEGQRQLVIYIQAQFERGRQGG